MAHSSFDEHLFRIQKATHVEMCQRVEDEVQTLEKTSQELQKQQKEIYETRQDFRKDVSFQSTLSMAATFFASVLTFLGIAASTSVAGLPASFLILASLYQTSRQLDKIQKMREHSFEQLHAMSPRKRPSESPLLLTLDLATAVATAYFTAPLLGINQANALGKGAMALGAFGAAASQTPSLMQSDFTRKLALLESKSLDVMLKEQKREEISQQIESAIDEQMKLMKQMQTCIALDTQARRDINQ